jgi:hypothetical protein
MSVPAAVAVADAVSELRDERPAEEIHAERMQILLVKIRSTGFYKLFKEVAPRQFVDFGWGDKESDTVALFGNALRLAECVGKPHFTFMCQVGVFHTILAFDADAELGGGRGGYLRWLRANVTGDLKFSTGRDLFRWQAPTPPAGGGAHRIFYVIFFQKGGERDIGKEAVVSRFSRERRAGFGVAALAKEQRLRLCGVNCNTFDYDDSVPKTVAELVDTAPPL